MNKTKSNKDRIISRIESELLSTLIDYVVPFFDKKIKTIRKEHSNNLENIINSNQKIDLKSIKELELLLSESLSKNIKTTKNFDVNKNDILYSLNLIRQKNENENSNNYSISIKYEENQNEEKFNISIKKDNNNIYSVQLTDKKIIKSDIMPYSVQISYEDGYNEERLNITYKQQLKSYLKKHIESKEDMTNRVPLKWLNILPETMMGGVLGFTYIGDHSMGRRADLAGQTARMVDIHESIHTPDEYETRVLTSWIMEKVKGKYVR